MSATESPVAEPTSVERRRMSYDEYKHWEHEGGLTEWIDGEVYIYIPPKDEHQNIVEFLDRLLGLFVLLHKLGKLRLAPFSMRAIEGGNAREPDLFFIATESLGRLTDTELNGPAELAIEIISTDSVLRD